MNERDEAAIGTAAASTRDAPEPTIVVILPSWVGDVVMAEPSLRALRDGPAPRRLVGLARPGLSELLAGTGLLHEVLEQDLRGLRGPVAAARRLRRAFPPAPDAILLLPNSFRAGLVARLTGSRERIGYRTDGRGWLLSRPVARPRSGTGPVAMVDWYADLVERAFGLSVTDRRPRLAPTAAQRELAMQLLAGVPRPVVVLNPGANRADKRWPARRFAAAGQELRRRGFGVAVNGGPAEAALASQVAQAAGGTDLAGRGMTLGGLVGVLDEAALLITNDTGPRHVALGLGTPVVALFGPTDHRWTAIPGAAERRLLAEPFLPENRVADGCAAACRMERIATGDVLAAAEQLIAARPRSGIK